MTRRATRTLIRTLYGAAAILCGLVVIASCSGAGDTEREIIDRPVGEGVSNDDASTTLLTNARVYPDAETDWVSSIAYGADGTIIAVGSEDDVVGIVGEDVRIIDGATHVVIAGAFLVQDEATFPVRRTDVTGELAPGTAADFTIIDRDPFSTDPDDLEAATVLLVVKSGVELYRSPAFDR